MPPQGSAATGNIWVVHLKNADATKLATVLRAAFGAGAGGGAGGGGGGARRADAPGNRGTAPQRHGAGGVAAAAAAPISASAGPSTGGFIQADPATNSLIITAPEPLYRQVRAMIDQLDARRAQVYIESLIVEVTGDNAADFGFQWQGVLGSKGDTNIVVGGTNFGTGGNLLDMIDQAQVGGNGDADDRRSAEGLNIGLVAQLRRHLRPGRDRPLPADAGQHQHPLDAEPGHARQRGSQDHRRQQRAVRHRPVHQDRRRARPTRSRPSSARTSASRCASSRRSARTARSA